MPLPTPKTRRHLSADGLCRTVRAGLERILDQRPQPQISLRDALLSAFAMFSLKDPSLLAFDVRRQDGNLQQLFGIGQVPCDTRMREILDPVDPEQLRPVFNDVFRGLQRGKALEPLVFHAGCYLLALDGTGYFSSRTVSYSIGALRLLPEEDQQPHGRGHLLPSNVGRGSGASRLSGGHPPCPGADHQAGRHDQERLRAQRRQEVAAENPAGTPASGADRGRGRPRQQCAAHPRTPGFGDALHPGGQAGRPYLLVRDTHRRLRCRPRDDPLLEDPGRWPHRSLLDPRLAAQRSEPRLAGELPAVHRVR